MKLPIQFLFESYPQIDEIKLRIHGMAQVVSINNQPCPLLFVINDYSEFTDLKPELKSFLVELDTTAEAFFAFLSKLHRFKEYFEHIGHSRHVTVSIRKDGEFCFHPPDRDM